LRYTKENEKTNSKIRLGGGGENPQKASSVACQEPCTKLQGVFGFLSTIKIFQILMFQQKTDVSGLYKILNDIPKYTIALFAGTLGAGKKRDSQW